MDYLRLVRLNQPLLAGTALVGLCSIVTGGLAGSAAGLTVPVLAGFSNFFAGMTGNNLGTLVERFRNSSDVLRNEDIAKAAGRKVAKALTEKISPKHPDKEWEPAILILTSILSKMPNRERRNGAFKKHS